MPGMIKELCAIHGVKNVRVSIAYFALNSVGFICYTSSNDPMVMHEHEIDESQYKIENNYKIGFKPVVDNNKVYAPRAMYIRDLESMINQGYVSVRVNIEEMIA